MQIITVHVARDIFVRSRNLPLNVNNIGQGQKAKKGKIYQDVFGIIHVLLLKNIT